MGELNPTSSTSSTEPTGTEPNPGGDPKPATEGQTFTQADVDRIVRERLAQQAKNKFGDYETLKTKAGESQTLEQRIADMEDRAAKAEASALRARIAAEHGISTKAGPKGEPSDADLFLTGTDESTLLAQAQRLAGREDDRKKQGNVARREGTTTSTGENKEDLREFAQSLFGSAAQ